MVVVVVRDILVRWLQMICLSRGSTPTVGSSKINSAGSWSKATARLARLENVEGKINERQFSSPLLSTAKIHYQSPFVRKI